MGIMEMLLNDANNKHEDDERVITDLVLNIATNNDEDDDDKSNGFEMIDDDKEDNNILDIDEIDIDNIPIYDEDDMIAKDQIENASEEEFIMEEHKEKMDERDNLEDDIEDTPSVNDIDNDPHNLLNVEFISEDYTSDDDYDFKKKLLFKPKWAKHEEEPGAIREYEQLTTKEYYQATREVLDNISYSKNMHIHKLQI